MIFFMFLQVGRLSEFFITVTTTVWFIACVNSFMALQVAGCCAFVITFGAAERFFTSMAQCASRLV